jgi:hypothetical protein
MATTELTATDVANRVRPYVTRKSIGDIRLSLDDARIQLRNGYWRILSARRESPILYSPITRRLRIWRTRCRRTRALELRLPPATPWRSSVAARLAPRPQPYAPYRQRPRASSARR